jgi:hypothetical protein
VSDKTLLDPHLASSGGGRMVAAATAAQNTVPELIKQVQKLCAGKPWGGDEPGQACDKTFSAIPGILDQVLKNVAAIGQVGKNIQLGIGLTVEADTAARDRIAASIANATPL